MDFDKMLNYGHGALPFKWEDFKLEILNKGRWVRYVDEYNTSPLRVQDENGEDYDGYNPWFSLIDSKMVITR